MLLDTLHGVIDRRILINFRVDKAALSAILPAPFKPQLIDGFGIAGLCLVRLRALRPKHLPAWAGLTVESAAHRVAVAWTERGRQRTGVFIPRRDTSSTVARVASEALFPASYGLASFDVNEEAGRFHVAMTSQDAGVSARFDGRLAEAWPTGSVFPTLDAATRFFREGSLGYSPAKGGGLDGLELEVSDFRLEPLAIDSVASSWFADPLRFPSGSVDLDSAALMRGVEHTWHARGPLRTDIEVDRANAEVRGAKPWSRAWCKSELPGF